MAISRWSPVSDLVSLHNTMDRLFSDSYAGRGRRRQDDIFGVIGEGFLPLDVYQTEKEWVIRAGVPNVNPENVEITCDGNTIRIAGEIKAPEENKSQNYVMRENFYGAFSREITLPADTMCETATAEFRNGTLLPRPTPAPTKHQPQSPPEKPAEANRSEWKGSQQRLESKTESPSQEGTTTGGAAGSATGEQSGAQQREPQGAARK